MNWSERSTEELPLKGRAGAVFRSAISCTHDRGEEVEEREIKIETEEEGGRVRYCKTES